MKVHTCQPIVKQEKEGNIQKEVRVEGYGEQIRKATPVNAIICASAGGTYEKGTTRHALTASPVRDNPPQKY